MKRTVNEQPTDRVGDRFWDFRRPTINRWWETAADERDLIPGTVPTTPTPPSPSPPLPSSSSPPPPPDARRTARIRCSRKTNRSKCRLVVPADDETRTGPLSADAIRSGVIRLNQAVAYLYNRWAAGPMAGDPESSDALKAFVHRLKWLNKSTKSVTDTCKHRLASLAEEHDLCWDEYKTLLAKLNCRHTAQGTGGGGPPSARNRFRDCVKWYGCYCT